MVVPSGMEALRGELEIVVAKRVEGS